MMVTWFKPVAMSSVVLFPPNQPPVHNKLLLSLSAAVYADTLPIPVTDPVRGGWLHTSTAPSEKFNYYFYGNNAPNPMLLNQLRGAFMVGVLTRVV